MTQAPLIETDRLRLRPHKITDVEPLWAFYQTDRARYLQSPRNRTHFWYGFSSEVGSWALRGWGGWAIETRDGDYIGQITVQQPPHFPELELGWILFEEWEGQGYAHEAARAARDYAFVVLDAPTLVSYIHRDNRRSIALAQRLGAVEDPRADRHDSDDIVYRHSQGGAA